MIQTIIEYKYKNVETTAEQETRISRLATKESISFLEAKERFFKNTLLNY